MPLSVQVKSFSNSTALTLVQTTHLTELQNTMYFVTFGQFQLHKLRNSDEDWVNNAVGLRLRGQVNRKPGKKLWIRSC